MADLSTIALKNNLLIDAKHAEAKSRIIGRIAELGLSNDKYKLDPEFLTLTCNLAEHLVSKKDKVDKKALVIEIFHDLFQTTEDEAAVLSKNIDFVCAQKGLVKKSSFYKLFVAGVREWFFKKH
jgi:hypothetical protein